MRLKRSSRRWRNLNDKLPFSKASDLFKGSMKSSFQKMYLGRLAFLLALQGCALNKIPARINCNKAGKGGTWVEVDTSGSIPLYNVTRYKNGEKNGKHYAYYLAHQNDGDPKGLMWRSEKGKYKKGKKVGFWVYYTTCGFYGNWVYYLGNKTFHNRYIGGNTRYALGPCPCDK